MVHRVVQILLTVTFLAHGWLLLLPPSGVVDQLNLSLPRWFQLFLGAAEVCAAVGLTLPGLTGVLPWLVTWAAGGIMIVMVSAVVFHLSRGELSSGAINVLLFAMAASVAKRRIPLRAIQGASTRERPR